MVNNSHENPLSCQWRTGDKIHLSQSYGVINRSIYDINSSGIAIVCEGGILFEMKQIHLGSAIG